MFKIENFFYNLIKTVNIEFRLLTNIETCILKIRSIKLIKESDDEKLIDINFFRPGSSQKELLN